MILFLKILSLFSYLAMVLVNALANILPINNITTGGVSDSYPNLFAPASFTFSIWAIIYLLLFLFVIYQFTQNNKKVLVKKINFLFIFSSLANILWILAWHYDLIGLSVILIILILLLLIKISDLLRVENLSFKEKFFMLIPFSIYFGWITVATIANITTYLVFLNWSAFSLSEEFWLVLILIIGTIIGLWRMFKDKCIAYGLVFVWAYIGIFTRHLSSSYIFALITLAICISLFSASFFMLKKNK